MRGKVVRLVGIGLIGIALVIGGGIMRSRLPQADPPSKVAQPTSKKSLNELEQRLARAAQVSPEKAQAIYRQLSQMPARSAEEKYVVGYARYQLGKLYAEQKQFRAAQQAFRQLAEQRLSVPALPLDSSFGTWSEQGAYQAAICAYQVDAQQGIQQMIDFMEKYPASPLVVGAYKRIKRWTNEKPPVAAERAWQRAQAAQRERLKASAACGPKALAYVLRHEFGIQISWEALMEECGTEVEGTSLWALAEAARRRGVSAVGLEVSRKGLLEREPPFIVWNPLGHYVAVIKRNEHWQIYDPAQGSPQPWLESCLPADWRGSVLLLRPRTLANQNQHEEGAGR